jgi:beta-N-acetylhexosaminidase
MTDGEIGKAIAKALGTWTIREKAGHLFLLAFPGKDPATAFPLIDGYNIAGCYLSQDNASDFAEAKALTAALQQRAARREPGAPLLLGVDQEGSWGVLVPESATGPGNMALGAVSPSLTEAMYRVFGEEMLRAGFNAIFAPCADVNTDPLSPIIGTRSFGQYPMAVSERVVAAVRGARSAGIATTVKHFPGHGGTRGDTHRELPRVDKSLERLMTEDFLTFRNGIAAGADLVMTSHIVFPALDPDRPATLSRKILGSLLRDDLGFRGVVISDSMNMGAMRKMYAPGESAVMALEAGVDLVMLSEEHYDHSAAYLGKQLETIAAVEEAIRSGRLSTAAVDEKLERILRLQFRLASGTDASPGLGGDVESKAAASACSLLFDTAGVWPIPETGKIVCVNASRREDYGNMVNPRGIGPNQATPAYDSFAAVFRGLRPSVRFLEHDEFMADADAVMDSADRILAITEDYPLPGEDFPKEGQRRLIAKALERNAAKTLVVGLRSPYEARGYAGIRAYFCSFSSRTCSARAAARAIHGGERGTGYSPVSYL